MKDENQPEYVGLLESKYTEIQVWHLYDPESQYETAKEEEKINRAWLNQKLSKILAFFLK